MKSNRRQNVDAYQRYILGKLLHGDGILSFHEEIGIHRVNDQISEYKLLNNGTKVKESFFRKFVHEEFFEHGAECDSGKSYKLNKKGMEKARELCDIHKRSNSRAQTQPNLKAAQTVSSPEESYLLKSNSTGRQNQFRRSAYLRKNIRAKHRH